MKIIIVLVGNILKFPPIISLINALEKERIQTIVITTKTQIQYNSYKSIKFDFIDVDYERISSPIKKMISLLHYRRKIWTKINREYTDDTIIWVCTNVSLKYLGNNILNKNYVLQLLELSDNLRFHPKIPLGLNKQRIGNKAKCIVVPEYNRAHIQKALWGLNKLPLVLHNKPNIDIDIKKNSDIDDYEAEKVLKKLRDKKIILYQGIMSTERPLDNIIKAVDKLGEDYAFVAMSGDKDLYREIGSSNYYFINFINPPYHLQITSNAYIGILVYVPTEKSSYSKLNSLYCAPNKIYEYGKFGIPMLGNDNPGLKFLFKTTMAGECTKDNSIESIIDKIKKIEKNYTKYEKASLDLYNSIDFNNELKEILKAIY